jgi:uncharacterized protein YegP (UPF0339 family)
VPAKFVVKKGVTGKFRFNLLSANGLVIASSQTYESKASCMAGLRAVQKNAAGAAIDDLTVAAKAAVAAKPAARKPAPKKAVAKKAVAKKVVAKKPVAKRPAAKKAAARKPAARKR